MKFMSNLLSIRIFQQAFIQIQSFSGQTLSYKLWEKEEAFHPDQFEFRIPLLHFKLLETPESL